MPRKETTPNKLLKTIRASAMSYPDVGEGIACEGTALEKRTFKARNKSFLFLGTADMMVKLGDSLPEATELASKEPGRYKVGARGWVTVLLGSEHPPMELLERWVDESYRMMTSK